LTTGLSASLPKWTLNFWWYYKSANDLTKVNGIFQISVSSTVVLNLT